MYMKTLEDKVGDYANQKSWGRHGKFRNGIPELSLVSLDSP